MYDNGMTDKIVWGNTAQTCSRQIASLFPGIYCVLFGLSWRRWFWMESIFPTYVAHPIWVHIRGANSPKGPQHWLGKLLHKLSYSKITSHQPCDRLYYMHSSSKGCFGRGPHAFFFNKPAGELVVYIFIKRKRPRLATTKRTCTVTFPGHHRS
jgi:hypothetical protein